MEQLRKWLETENIKPCRFAERINRRSSTIYRILSGKRGVSPQMALDIERGTNGEISAISLLANKLESVSSQSSFHSPAER
jgi:Plasmid maintenance system antidote protein